MASGDLALVLHAHLPYVRSGEPGSLEEDWYFQALQECYLPLLEVLEAAAADSPHPPVRGLWAGSRGESALDHDDVVEALSVSSAVARVEFSSLLELLCVETMGINVLLSTN